MRRQRVSDHAQSQTNHWPDENTTDRACLGNADSNSAYDAVSWKDEENLTTKDGTEKDGRCSHRQSKNNAAQFFTKTTSSSKGLVSRINFAIQSAKV